jgi:hypothetical protein
MSSVIVGVTRAGPLHTLPRLGPTTVLVLTYPQAERPLVEYRRPPAFKERRGAGFAFLVDVGRRRSVVRTQVPAKGEAYHFVLEADVEWAVEDAVEAVRDEVYEAGEFLQRHLRDTAWPLSRHFTPQQAPALELELQALLRERRRLPGGIELLQHTLRVTMDRRLVRFTPNGAPATSNGATGSSVMT